MIFFMGGFLKKPKTNDFFNTQGIQNNIAHMNKLSFSRD